MCIIFSEECFTESDQDWNDAGDGSDTPKNINNVEDNRNKY